MLILPLGLVLRRRSTTALALRLLYRSDRELDRTGRREMNSRMRESTDDPSFDFECHRRAAVEEYRQYQDRYTDFSKKLHDILTAIIRDSNLPFVAVFSRSKTLESFGRKASLRDPDNPTQPRYTRPLEQITDLAGARVVTIFQSTVQ
jgi:ppGpp synthetase/RelA/SpoT-type nucleotidyltranferase